MTKHSLTIKGIVQEGYGQAAYFTQLAWVQRQCVEKLDFKPFPGTLNVKISLDDILRLDGLCQELGVPLVSAEKQFCDAMVLPIYLGGILGGLLFPEAKVKVHAQNIIEVIAPVNLRDTFHLQNESIINFTVLF